MATYLPTPDNSSTCCDCPTRVNACDDCVEITIDTQCDAISNEDHKCAYRRAVGGGGYHYYLNFNFSWSSSFSDSSMDCANCSITSSASSTFGFNENCTQIETGCSGSTDEFDCEGAESTGNFVAVGNDCQWDDADPFFSGLGSQLSDCYQALSYDLATAETVDVETYTNSNGSATAVSTYVSSFSDNDMQTQVRAGLPSYDGVFGDGCSAHRFTTRDPFRITMNVQRFRYKHVPSSTPSAGRTLYWNEHFIPDVGSPSNTARTFTFDGAQTETSTLEVLDPSSDGEITITNVRWTL